MTQEDKKLLLADLSARLPYGVMLDTPNGNKPLLALVSSKKYNTIVEYDDYHGNENDISEWEGGDVELIKPYLRPMSSMTEEEKHKLLRFGAVNLDKDNNANDVCCVGFWNHAKVQDYLNSIHIDYRGLIPKGLAIEVTEDNNPYKE